MNLIDDPMTGKPLSEQDLKILASALKIFHREGPKRFADKGYPPHLQNMLNEIVGVAFSGGFVMGASFRDHPELWKKEFS